MKYKTIYLFLIIISALILVASMWNLDFVMWYKSSYWYYPIPGYWNRPVEKSELGLYVNLQYYQIAIAFIVSTLSAYKLAQQKPKQ